MSDVAAALAERGEAYVTALVVRAVAPTSAKPGDRAVITSEGVVHGWIGGSCAEPTVRREAAAALVDGQPRLVHITPEPPSSDDRSGLVVVPMTCYSGGALEVFIEPHPAKPSLVVCGNSPVAQALVDLGRRLGFLTSVLDLSERPELVGADRVGRKLSVLEDWVSDESFVVVASHGTFDEESLEAALRWGPAYLGMVTSARRFSSLRAGLARRGVSAEALDRVRAPAGLDLGATTPEEIALSILAEVTARRRGRASGSETLGGAGTASHREAAAPEAAPASTASAAPSTSSCCAKKKTGND
ncbi:MAG: XdhC family protein [Myxococcota bacterium]